MELKSVLTKKHFTLMKVFREKFGHSTLTVKAIRIVSLTIVKIVKTVNVATDTTSFSMMKC